MAYLARLCGALAVALSCGWPVTAHADKGDLSAGVQAVWAPLHGGRLGGAVTLGAADRIDVRLEAGTGVWMANPTLLGALGVTLKYDVLTYVPALSFLVGGINPELRPRFIYGARAEVETFVSMRQSWHVGLGIWRDPNHTVAEVVAACMWH